MFAKVKLCIFFVTDMILIIIKKEIIKATIKE